jgi:enoyl-CoA hydratase
MLDQDVVFSMVSDSFGKKTGLITLNRPRYLNALSSSMVTQLHDTLLEWKDDPSIKCVIVESKVSKSFCAGGDIRSLYEAKDVDFEKKINFFEIEYSLNNIIHNFGKPYISLLNGLVMGGGAGLSLHGSHPIASQNIYLAMPEAMIGFFPDVGVMYMLSRLPHNIGLWMSLTGLGINSTDAVKLGLVHSVVTYSDFDILRDEVMASDLSADAFVRVDDIVSKYVVSSSDGMWQYRHAIEKCFSAADVEGVVSLVNLQQDAWWDDSKKALQYNSPLSLKVALQYYNLACKLNIEEVLSLDLNLSYRFLQGHDFMEGVRAKVVDKDHSPNWQPPLLSEVTNNLVDGYFMLSSRT